MLHAFALLKWWENGSKASELIGILLCLQEQGKIKSLRIWSNCMRL